MFDVKIVDLQLISPPIYEQFFHAKVFSGKAFNIEYGNIDFEKVIIDSMLTKFEKKNFDVI